MNSRYIQIIGIATVVIGLTFITFIYWAQPRSISEVSSKGQVVIGTYDIDRNEFDQGLANFHRDEFLAARAAFERADPQKRDALAQFYIAYSFYRQGWGVVSNEDALFKAGVESADRVITLDPNFRVADPRLVMKTPFELKAELEDGLNITAGDFNPLKLTRERK